MPRIGFFQVTPTGRMGLAYVDKIAHITPLPDQDGVFQFTFAVEAPPLIVFAPDLAAIREIIRTAEDVGARSRRTKSKKGADT